MTGQEVPARWDFSGIRMLCINLVESKMPIVMVNAVTKILPVVRNRPWTLNEDHVYVVYPRQSLQYFEYSRRSRPVRRRKWMLLVGPSHTTQRPAA
jgi:hypothetical protein